MPRPGPWPPCIGFYPTSLSWSWPGFGGSSPSSLLTVVPALDPYDLSRGVNILNVSLASNRFRLDLIAPLYSRAVSGSVRSALRLLPSHPLPVPLVFYEHGWSATLVLA